jgi:hypothetical protein
VYAPYVAKGPVKGTRAPILTSETASLGCDINTKAPAAAATTTSTATIAAITDFFTPIHTLMAIFIV